MTKDTKSTVPVKKKKKKNERKSNEEKKEKKKKKVGAIPGIEPGTFGIALALNYS